MLDDAKNAGVTAVWGDLYRSPFTGGFFVVNPEHSWQRLTAYTTTGETRIRQHAKEMVTNRFVADSFMRFAVVDNGRDLFRALRPSGLTGAPHETVSSKARSLDPVRRGEADPSRACRCCRARRRRSGTT